MINDEAVIINVEAYIACVVIAIVLVYPVVTNILTDGKPIKVSCERQLFNGFGTNSRNRCC